MLCFAFIVGIRVVVLYFLPTITNIMTVCAAIIIAYMSGRLHKYEEMKHIVLIVSLLLVYVGITSIVLKNNAVQNITINFEVINSAFTPVFIWTALSGAYFVRYTEHKEASLNA
jgi:ABC-type xylose transport system permease subunit